MQQDAELRALVRAVESFRRRGATRYPAKLRAEITAWVIAQRERGQWWTELSAAIGLPTQTLVRWAEQRTSAVATMRAVDVVDAPPADTVTLVAPSGVRLEGVSIESAIAILRGLA